ncbi:MAG: lipid-A-disaccharide synthase [Chitinophagales bacterium]|nr:lipid-A-disaccharide synthase [Chitinophagales bacterium]MDW8392744.1 lipid-A-disaccharide synthase [Chitinophagales bacterium]
MRIYVIAGEASGDLHGAHLIHALRQQREGLEFRGIGGDRMAAAGMSLLLHYRHTAFMGFWEVVRHLPRILQALRQTQADLLRWRPDVLVLIDYPGFNLRMARWAHRRGIKVVYYISPQLWAWKPSRVKIIRRHVDRLLVILPFEPLFYEQHGVQAFFVGHPLLDALAAQQPIPSDQRGRLIALLPGSRRQEVATMLPVMLKAARQISDVQIEVAGLGTLGKSFYEQFLSSFPEVQLRLDDTYGILGRARAAVVTSGTATLETALMNVPQVVCYRGSRLSYWIARRLVRVPYISLVNLIVNRPLVRELIQQQMEASNIAAELHRLINDAAYRSEQLSGYDALRKLLGEAGASERAASHVLQCAESSASAIFASPEASLQAHKGN